MRSLTDNEKSIFERTIAKYVHIKGTGGSWFSYKVASQLSKDISLWLPHAPKDPHPTMRFLSGLESALKELKYLEVVVFPEPGWDPSEAGGLAKPLILQIDELKNLIEIGFGPTNYYIVPNLEDFQWIITLCHDDDFHIAGKEDFVHHLELRLRRLLPELL